MFFRLRNTLARFMMGRYGPDSFGNFLLIFYFAFAVICYTIRFALGGIPYYICSLLQTALLIYIFFRLLSRNIYKRQRENAKYWAIKGKVLQYFRLRKQKWETRKTNVWRKCPNCRATIKLPRKKGKHTCTCPKCRVDFKVRVLRGAKRIK